MSNNPKVSVIMPVYKGEKYIREAVDSIIAQTFTDFEILIVLTEDPDLRDKSRKIIESYSDPRVRLILNNVKGLSPARNKGIELSRGQYIANLDCDDRSHPSRFQKQVDFLDNHPDFGLIGSSIENIDKRTQVMNGSVWLFPASAEEVPVILFFSNYFAQSATMIRKSALPIIGYSTSRPVAEDYDLWIRIAEKSKVWNLPGILTQIRLHGENSTITFQALHPPTTKKIYAYQLDKLNFSYSPEELDNHYLFCVGQYETTVEHCKILKAWFDKINTANYTAGSYDHVIFTKALLGRWFLFCKRTDAYWWLPHKIFWRSSLLRLSHLNFKAKITFISKIIPLFTRKLSIVK